MPVLPAQNEEYADFIMQYSQNIDGNVEYQSNEFFEMVDDNYAVRYVALKSIGELSVTDYNYGAIPKYYVPMDEEALNASGILRVQNQPYLDLKGRGTAVAIIDSGIDYENIAFRDVAGGSRIAYLWDQELIADSSNSLGGQNPTVPYGIEFSKIQINEALKSENPQEIVPSEDASGHGTFLAGIAAGSGDAVRNFLGAAPEAALIVVKLKKIKRYLREFYLLPEEADAYQENDIMLAIEYAINRARRMNMPLSICIGLGTNLGAHLGVGPLSQYMDGVSRYEQNAISVSAGNEGNQRHHFGGIIETGEQEVTVEMRAAPGEKGFVMEFWGNSPNYFSMRIQTPFGEEADVLTVRGGNAQDIRFVFSNTRIQASYVRLERQSGNTLIFLRFIEPAEGIWRFRIFSNAIYNAGFHMWLPVRGMISDDTYFLESSPANTITNPGDARSAMTVTAYDYRNDSLYLEASRGYLTDGTVKPDFAAPGVEILGTLPRGRFVRRSGTSISAAQAAGAAALFFEWGSVRGNMPFLNGTSIKNYFLRAAVRSDGREYPNPEWGYGKLNLYSVFELLS